MKNIILPAFLLMEFTTNIGHGMEQPKAERACYHIPDVIIHSPKVHQEGTVHIPSDISKLLYSYIHDEKDIVSFWGTCRALKAFGDNYYKEYYEKKNKEERILPWKECPDLPPRILNRLNTDYRFLLGMHRNIALYKDKVSNTDRARFEIACDHIQKTTYLPEKSLIKSFAELLRLQLYLRRYSNYYIYSENRKISSYVDKIDSYHSKTNDNESNCILRHKKVKIGIQLAVIMEKKDVNFQNEIVLYFYLLGILSNNGNFYHVREETFFNKPTCNLFDVIKNHDTLDNLQSKTAKTIQDLERIIELDCAPTEHTYKAAALSYSNARKYKESLKYYKILLEIEQQGAANKPNLDYIHKINEVYVTMFMSQNSLNSKDSQSLAYYYDQFFEQYHLQKEEAKRFAYDELRMLKNAVIFHGNLENKEKVTYYENCIKEYEAAEILRQVAAARDKEEADAAEGGVPDTQNPNENCCVM